MKLIDSLLLSQLLGHSVIHGFVYGTGPLPRNSRVPKSRRGYAQTNGDFEYFASSPRGSRRGDRNNNYDREAEAEAINRAFRELQNELSEANFNVVNQNWNKMVTETVDKDVAKKWIDKTLDLASEFNKDFTDVPDLRDANDEGLRKTRDWLNEWYDGVYNNNDGDEKATSIDDDKGPSPSGQEAGAPETGTKGEDIKVNLPSSVTKPNGIVTVTPNLENRSDETRFRVALDLPGVDRTGVDIAVQDDFLVVIAERAASRDGSPIRVYTKKIAIPGNQVVLDELEATLRDGVLVITAPKKPVVEKRRKIPIS